MRHGEQAPLARRGLLAGADGDSAAAGAAHPGAAAAPAPLVGGPRLVARASGQAQAAARCDRCARYAPCAVLDVSYSSRVAAVDAALDAFRWGDVADAAANANANANDAGTTGDAGGDPSPEACLGPGFDRAAFERAYCDLEHWRGASGVQVFRGAAPPEELARMQAHANTIPYPPVVVVLQRTFVD